MAKRQNETENRENPEPKDKESVSGMESQTADQVVPVAAKQEPDVTIHGNGNGTVTLNIDDSEASSVVASASGHHPEVYDPLPPVPTSIEFPIDNAEEDGPSKEALNQSSEEDDAGSNSNTNTSPVVTPIARSERAADVRHWVESDNRTKLLHQDRPPDSSPPSSPPENYIFYNQGSIHGGFQSSSRPSQMDTRNGLAGTEAFELELTQLRQDNIHLQKREQELVGQLQNVEMVIQTLTQEREALQQQIRTDYLPLKQKFTKFSDENTELKVMISDLRVQLNSTLEESEAKNKAFEEMQFAFIKIVSSYKVLSL